MCEPGILIPLIKQRPAIYNYNLKEHADKKYLESLWKEIAHEMNLTPKIVKHKWGSLRNSYARQVRLGFDPESKRKIWYHAESMSFLNDFMRNMNADSYNSFNESKLDSKKEHQLRKSERKKKAEVMEDDMDKIEHFCNPFDENELAAAAFACSAQFKTSPSVTMNDNRDELTPSTLLKFRNSCSNDQEAEDANLTFFRSLIPDLEKLSAKRQRTLKQDLLVNLNSLLDEQENDNTLPNNAPTPDCVG